MKKRFFIIVLILFLVVFVTHLWSAGGKGESPSSKGTQKIELSCWHYFSLATYEAFKSIIAEYNASTNGKVTIVEQYIPRNELLKRYTLGVVSNELPDLAIVDNPDSCSFAAMGMFVDITERVNRWSDNKFLTGPLNSGSYKGKQYTLPSRNNCLALWANKMMLKTAGIENLPSTWEELEKVARKLQETNPKVYPLAFSAIKNEEGTFQFLPFLYSAGATIQTIDSPEGVRAFTFIKNLVQNKFVSAECINWSQNDVQKQFASGNAAMMINGPWHIPNMKRDAPDLEYIIGFLPKDKAYASSLGGENIGITKAVKNVEAAWDFITWFLSTENNVKFNRATRTISPKANATSAIQYPNDPVMKVFVEQLSFAVPRGPHPKWPEISATIQDAIHQSIIGTKTPEAVVKDAGSRIAQIHASIQ